MTKDPKLTISLYDSSSGNLKIEKLATYVISNRRVDGALELLEEKIYIDEEVYVLELCFSEKNGGLSATILKNNEIFFRVGAHCLGSCHFYTKISDGRLLELLFEKRRESANS